MLKIMFAVFAWSLVILTICSIWQTLKAGIHHVKKLHRIPCANCEYFTNDYRLKCTVNPIHACTEDAIYCLDFEVKTCACNSSERGRIKLL